MAIQERDELLHLVQELPDDEVRELLALYSETDPPPATISARSPPKGAALG